MVILMNRGGIITYTITYDKWKCPFRNIPPQRGTSSRKINQRKVQRINQNTWGTFYNLKPCFTSTKILACRSKSGINLVPFMEIHGQYTDLMIGRLGNWGNPGSMDQGLFVSICSSGGWECNWIISYTHFLE